MVIEIFSLSPLWMSSGPAGKGYLGEMGVVWVYCDEYGPRRGSYVWVGSYQARCQLCDSNMKRR